MLPPAVIIMYLLTAQEHLCLTKPTVMGQSVPGHTRTPEHLTKAGQD